MDPREPLVATAVIAAVALLINAGVCVGGLTDTEYSQGMSAAFGTVYLAPTVLAIAALAMALRGSKVSRFIVALPVLTALPVLFFAALSLVDALT